MKKKILILILVFVLGITNVDAAYKATSSENNMAGKDASDYPIISTSDKGDAHVGSGESITLNNGTNSLDAYCIDPGKGTPDGNVEFVEGNISDISEYVEGLRMICQKTKGNEILRIALIKAYSVNSGLGSASASIAANYEGLLAATPTTKFNPMYTEGIDALGILKGAVESVDDDASGDIISLEPKEEKILLTTNVPGVIKLKNSADFEMQIYGNNVTEYKVELNSGEQRIIEIAFKVKNCVDGTKNQPEIIFEYEEKNLTVGDSNIGYYVAKNSTDREALQRVITCEDDGSAHDCTDGICTKTEKVEITCDAEVCEEPEVKKGTELCGDSGDTVISVTETPNKLDYIGSKCFSDLPLATETILGHTNEYCEIRCSENYKLELPGPDSKEGDSEVKINAGSYFTIATEDESGNSLMYDESTYTCYGKMNISKYQADLYTIKKNVADYYNTMSQAAALLAILNREKPDAEGICPAAEESYDILEVESSGKFVLKTNGAKQTFEKSTCTEETIDDAKKRQQTNLANAIQNLSTYIETANKTIEEKNAKWNECSGWSIEKLNEIYSEDKCNTEIDFKYSSEDICDSKVVVDEIDYIESSDIKTHNSTATSEKVYNGKMDISKEIDDWNKAGTTEAYSYINQQASIKTTYKFDNDFTVEYATGKVSCEANTDEGYSEVINGFPVSINSQQGLHEYEYTYTNIGHNFDVGSTCSGRFDSVINDKDNHKCLYDVNNCDDCEVYCDPEGVCTQESCDGECQVSCVGSGCIIDANAGFLATYRTVSLNETFKVAMLSSHDGVSYIALAGGDKLDKYSSNKDFSGSNWDNAKGNATKANINNLGETIYNDEPEYSITLTPAVISNIKKYNAEQEDFEESDAKGYLNNTLKCTNVNGTDYGQCISTFVHNSDNKWSFKVLDEKTSSDQVIVEIDGNKAIFKSYLGDTKAFEGPAWK